MLRRRALLLSGASALLATPRPVRAQGTAIGE